MDEGISSVNNSQRNSFFRAELLSHPHLENCYISRLTVKSVDHRDARSYHVSVTNMHGSDSAPVHLTIRGKKHSRYDTVR